MKKLILLLLCISIGYACKKKEVAPQETAKISNVSCDTIYCIQATANAHYVYLAQGGGNDTNMTNHNFRMLYVGKDSVFNGPQNKWDVYMNYVLKNATFNTNIINSSCLTFRRPYGTGNNGILITTKNGMSAFFQKTTLYH